MGEILIANGADINSPETGRITTPLHYAVKNNSKEIEELLLNLFKGFKSY